MFLVAVLDSLSVVPFLCPHDDFRSMSIRELALDFGDFPSSASVVRTPKRLADLKVLTIAKINKCKPHEKNKNEVKGGHLKSF